MRRIALGMIRLYQLLVSPHLGRRCRFHPSCSQYALAALQEHGACAGSYLTLRRLVRCQPWCAGGHDPVPPAGARLFEFAACAASPEKKSSP